MTTASGGSAMRYGIIATLVLLAFAGLLATLIIMQPG
jgi:hypothetical protein